MPTTLGRYYDLTLIDRLADGHWVFDARDLGQALLPEPSVYERRKPFELGTRYQVFLYSGRDNVVYASLKPNQVAVGECGLFKVKQVGAFGAFLDWGLPRDLLLPKAEQSNPVEKGSMCYAYLTLGNDHQPIASTKLHKYLQESSGPYHKGDAVEAVVYGETPLGYKMVFEQQYLGLVYKSELNRPMAIGSQHKVRIKATRDDGLVDLSLHQLSTDDRDSLNQTILDYLAKNQGRANLSDKSSPDDIYRVFKVSKKNFKRALSQLYKARQIQIYPDRIERVD